MSAENTQPSPAQRLLNEGKYLITRSEGYWHALLPRTSWLAEFFGDTVFRTGFDSDTPEATVREFYAKRLNVAGSEIVTV